MRVGIIGAGFAGLAAAISFRQTGHDVTVFERASRPSAAGGAIVLARNALSCLAVLGIDTHFQGFFHTRKTLLKMIFKGEC